MGVKNITKKTIVAKQVVEANGMLQKSFGLLLYKAPKAMLFQTRFGIHTFFMRYPIDVVILDKEFKVVALKIDMKPGRIFVWNPRYEYVLELPQGSIVETKTSLHDVFLMT
jgi:uncharacterized membrane protein (UPF0127 family)